MKSNTQQLAIARKYLGCGGSKFRKFCGLPAGAAWCDAFVTTIFAEADNKSLFCGGSKQTYCPTTIKWCYKNLACIPPYIALPSDIIFFDWEPNGVPNHIGFVRERKDCDSIYTIEGNTSGGIVANRTRNTKYVCGIFRPHFPASYKIGTLEVDGLMGYCTIAMLQRALKVEVDGILGKGTLKALQKWAGVKQDAIWRKGTSKAIQKKLGVTADGYFGKNSVKALQKWCNDQYKSSPAPTPTPAPTTKNLGQKIADTATSYIGKSKYVKGGTNIKTGVDCTGFVQEMYRLNGIKLSASLSSWGKSIGTDISKAKPGDIITYRNNSDNKLRHHGIYVGNKKVVHASGSHSNHKKDIVKSGYSFSGMHVSGIRRRWK